MTTPKTWFITGASSGLGLGLTDTLLARGDRVVATVRRQGALSTLQARHGDRLAVLPLDVTDVQAIRAVTAEAFQRMGRIDVVVSNAGYGLFGAAEELSDAQIDRQIATNLLGSIQLIRACLPLLRAQGGGQVLQVSSEGGQIAYPGFSLYHATKWGIEGFVESVAQEVQGLGIDFLLVEPGPTATGFGSALDQAEPLPAYEPTPAGALRRAFTSGGFALRGDAQRTVAAMVAAADERTPGLRRLALGSTAYASIHAALQRRCRELQAQQALAFSADIDG